jgi:hypothetical protein
MAVTHRSFAGREFALAEVRLVREIVESCAGLSRRELAHTVCELVGWHRPNGALKARECREFLERLEAGGHLRLPAKRARRPVGSRTAVPHTPHGEPGPRLRGSVRDVAPITVVPVSSREDHQVFRELVGRYHYLGHAGPFGAQQRYLVQVARPRPAVVGCLQFSSPAWRMAARDRWIGWDEATRARNLQHVVNNSRFLLVPWVQVKNLASAVLARGLRQVRGDWRDRYAVEPYLVETLVDGRCYAGTCYRAANWLVVGETTGRGRMDRYHRRAGAAPKAVLLYPLVNDAARRLREG